MAVLAFLLVQTQSQTATIEGTVFRIGTGRPIRDARVEVMSQVRRNSTGAMSTSTDAEGRFVLSGVEPGTYRIEVAADGFARQQYGMAAPLGLEGTSAGRTLGKAVSVVAGQRLQGLAIHLTPTGSISGTLREWDGRPAARVWVQLLRPVYSFDGKKTFVVVGKAYTDDHGNYRLYWITPGRYYVGAGSSLDSEETLSEIGLEPRSSLRFFPGVSGIERAEAIDLVAGAELTDVNITLAELKTYSIRGRVVDAISGKPPTTAVPYLAFMGFTRSHNLRSDGRNYDPADGSFEFEDVAPGKYLLGVFESAPGRHSRVSVDVANANVEGLVVELKPPVSIPIRASLDQGTFSSITGFDRWRLSLDAVFDGTGLESVGRSPVFKADGTSVLENIPPGPYRLQLSGPSPEVYVKELKYAGKDVLGETFLVSADEPGPLTIVLGSNPGQIDGLIINEDKQPIPGIRAVLIPDKQRKRTDLYSTALSDSSGHFAFRGLPPGDYKLFAWESIEPYSWYDATVIQGHEPLGKPVHVAGSSTQTVEVRVIP
jgi:5-hydroxyisourate hydrolase-like protein (transthyretin family)